MSDLKKTLQALKEVRLAALKEFEDGLSNIEDEDIEKELIQLRAKAENGDYTVSELINIAKEYASKFSRDE